MQNKNNLMELVFMKPIVHGKVILITFFIIIFLITPFAIRAEIKDDKYELIVPKVRFAVVDKTEILNPEQSEEILFVYSDYEDNTSIQLTLLIVNSLDDVSGNEFLDKFSGWAEKRLVIKLILSTKEVMLFGTEPLNNSLEKISKNYQTIFEPYLAKGNIYEAALKGSLEIIKILSPEYNVP